MIFILLAFQRQLVNPNTLINLLNRLYSIKYPKQNIGAVSIID